MRNYRQVRPSRLSKLIPARAIGFALLFTLCIMRLGNMQLEGVLPISVGLVAVSMAFASLMYNRAKAVSQRSAQFRSLFAAEHALRAAVPFVIYAVFIAVVSRLQSAWVRYQHRQIKGRFNSPQCSLLSCPVGFYTGVLNRSSRPSLSCFLTQ